MNTTLDKIIEERKEDLKEEIERKLPKFKRMIKINADNIIFHQDAWAGDYQFEEYILLGKVIKYIGLTGKNITIVGKKQKTLD